MSETGVLTSSLMWRAALVTALIDAPLLFLAARLVSAELFRRLKWYLAGAAAFVFAAIWLVVGSLVFWDSVYSLIFPAWFHWLLPLIYGSLFGLYGLLFWRLSLFARRGQVLWFIILGGLVSLVGHSVGARLGLMQVPLLTQTSVASAFIFGVFEFTFYFLVIVGLASLARWVGTRLRGANK